MSVTIKKLTVSDIATIQRLVVEHADGIEPGLAVLDSRLLVGQATIDVVACDANASLVLITVGLVANEDMLLQAVEAYSWCLEYPEAVRRLYPAADISADRPPRMVFVVERVPDAFHRRIKQLGFSEVDFVEARYLDVDGTPAVFFDVVARLRRGVPPAPAVVPASATTTLLSMSADAPAPRRVPGAEPAAIAENVIPLNGGARTTAAKLQRLLNTAGDPASPRSAVVPTPPRGAVTPATTRPMPMRAGAESTTVVTAVPTQAHEGGTVVPFPTLTAGAPPDGASSPIDLESARLSLREAAAAHEPTAQRESPNGAAASVAEAEPLSRVSFMDIANELLGAPAPPPGAASSGVTAMPYPIDEDARAAIEELLGTTPNTDDPANDREPEIVASQLAEPAAVATPVARPKPVEPPVWAAVKPQAAITTQPTGDGASKAAVEPKITIKPPVAATPGVTPAMPRMGVKPPVAHPVVAATPAAQPPAAPAPAARPAATAPAPEQKSTASVPTEIAGLQFPNDAQLTRQWMEFLNQMNASK